MDLITGPMYPQSLNMLERQTVFNIEALKSSIYTHPSTNQFPHMFTEAEAVYAMPVIAKREIWTPDNGMRLIYQIAFPIAAMNGYAANGIWNHILPMAPDFEE